MTTFPGYMINDLSVTTPESESWAESVVGMTLAMTQRRSPYRVLTWRRNIVGRCNTDWFQFDNTRLTSLTTRAPGSLNEWVRYTDVVCQSVTMRHSLNRGQQVEAIFLVNTEL